MKRSPILPALLFSLYFSACHPAASHSGDDTGDSTSGPAAPKLTRFKPNPELRAQVKKEPVTEYREKTDNALNDWYFSVRLYQTHKTMYYLAKLTFEDVEGEDTIRLPDLGVPPQPILKKGKDKYSCIIGFLDNDHQFRDLKLVYVTARGRELKITTLKHYVVMDHFRLRSE